jgi:hypothetical protein
LWSSYLTSDLVVSRAGHVWLAAGDRSKLGVKLFEDRLVCVLPVKKILRLLEPVVG